LDIEISKYFHKYLNFFQKPLDIDDKIYYLIDVVRERLSPLTLNLTPFIMTVEQAIQTIVHFQTLPPQIDYISPARRAEFREAEELIESLPTVEQQTAYEAIQAQIDEYFTPSFQGADGECYSPADLNSLF